VTFLGSFISAHETWEQLFTCWVNIFVQYRSFLIMAHLPHSPFYDSSPMAGFSGEAPLYRPLKAFADFSLLFRIACERSGGEEGRWEGGGAALSVFGIPLPPRAN
jgi:hypothetical protein